MVIDVKKDIRAVVVVSFCVESEIGHNPPACREKDAAQAFLMQGRRKNLLEECRNGLI